MVEQNTYQNQIKNTVFDPVFKITVLALQNKYDAVWTRNEKTKKVSQRYPSIKEVKDDQAEVFRSTEFIGANFYGINDQFIINKDLDNYNITAADMDRMEANLVVVIKQNPDKKHFILFFIGGHGMLKEGASFMLLNEIDNMTQFYRLYPNEDQIRNMAKNNTQTYFVACFACCREIYLWKSHSGCVGATTKEEAEALYEEEDNALKRIAEKQMSLEE